MLHISRAFAARAARGLHSYCSVNGVRVDAAGAACSIWDVTFQRGDGAFEAMRVLPAEGARPARPRASHLNLDRLERSAAGIRMPLPPREDVSRWLREAAAATGEGYLRLMATRGSAPGYGDHLGAELDAPPKVFIVWQPIPPRVASTSLCPMVAPWHPAGFSREWETVKWLSYGANMHCARLAREAGYDQALLLRRDDALRELAEMAGGDFRGLDDAAERDSSGGFGSLLGRHAVLDGPNFAVAWADASGETLYTPSWRELGLLQSTTLTLMLEAARRAGLNVDEGTHTLDDAQRTASEFFVLSTTRDLLPVHQVGDVAIPAVDGPVQARLQAAMDALVEELDEEEGPL